MNWWERNWHMVCIGGFMAAAFTIVIVSGVSDQERREVIDAALTKQDLTSPEEFEKEMNAHFDAQIRRQEKRTRDLFAIGFYRGAKWEAKRCDIIFTETPDGNEAEAEGYRLYDWAEKKTRQMNKEKK